LGPYIAFDYKGFKASGYAIITLAALKHLYEISLWGILTFT